MNAGAAPERSVAVAHGRDDGASLKHVWIGGRRAIEVPCTVEIEQTSDILFANVALEGIDVDAGDEVIVHEAPSHIPFGAHSITKSHATVIRATGLERLWTRITAYLELTELYEVGFQPKE
jgi:hypothetical protein